MRNLSLRLLLVVGLSAGLASAACTDQSSEKAFEGQEQEIEQGSGRVTEDVSGDQQSAQPPVAEDQEISEEERRELEEWMNEKLREGQEQEAEAEREEK